MQEEIIYKCLLKSKNLITMLSAKKTDFCISVCKKILFSGGNINAVWSAGSGRNQNGLRDRK